MIIDNPTISGSALLSGSLTITGSLNVSGSISGLASNAVSASYALISTSASYALVATSASQANNADTATSASYALVATSASYALNATTSSFALNATTSSFALVATSASYTSNADLLDNRDSLTFANTGSNNFVGTQNINGSVAITGSLTTTGAITAQTLNVQQVTSSIVYSSGSNIFGNSVSNTQSMTGSVGISGSLAVVGAGTITGALTLNSTITNGTYTYTLPSATGTLALTSALSSYLPLAGGTLTGALSGTSVTLSGNIIFDTTDRGIVSNTSDGSDNKFVSINGGGARGDTRGGGINIFGNESAGTGRIDVNAGDVVGGVINLVTAGLNRLTVNRDGTTTLAQALSGTSATFSSTVGIGTATIPAAELQVGKASDVTFAMSNSSSVTSGNRGSIAWYNSSNSTVANIRAVALTDDKGTGLEFYTRPVAGNLTKTFDIASTGAATFSGNLSCSGASIQLNQTELISSTGASNRAYAFNLGNVAAGDFSISQGSSATGGTYTTRLIISPTGNVGIGTTSPNGPLDVVGPNYGGLYTLSLIDSAAVAADIGGGIYFGGNYTGTTKTGWAGILGRKDNATDGQYGGYMVFQTRTHGSSPAERMRITSGGTVLVGATDPDVGGSVKGAAIRGDGSIVGATNISSPVHYQSPITADRMNTMGDGVMYGMWRQGIFQAGIGATNGSVMTFFTGNNSSMTECMRINSSSNVLIGTTSDVSAKIYIVGSASYGIVYQNASNVNNFYVGVGGDGYLRAASWSYGSDRRIKENISYIETGLNKVLALKPATFDYIDGIKNNIGWIAQDVQEVIPEAIGTISKTNDQLTLKSDFIIPYLVKAIQEQQAQIESQQAQITELQNK